MPSALLRACSGRPGCPNLVAKGACPDCSRQRAKADRQNRGTAAERGYTTRWAGFRRWWINRLPGFGVAPVCGARWPGAPATTDSRCAAEGVLNDRDLELDHIEPFMRADGSLDEKRQYDPRNLQLLCRSDHSRKTATKDSRFVRAKA